MLASWRASRFFVRAYFGRLKTDQLLQARVSQKRVEFGNNFRKFASLSQQATKVKRFSQLQLRISNQTKPFKANLLFSLRLAFSLRSSSSSFEFRLFVCLSLALLCNAFCRAPICELRRKELRFALHSLVSRFVRANSVSTRIHLQSCKRLSALFGAVLLWAATSQLRAAELHCFAVVFPFAKTQSSPWRFIV